MVCKDGGQKPLAITRVWQKWRFSAPQTHLWLVKVWFSASKFVVKIATFAKPENVKKNPTHICGIPPPGGDLVGKYLLLLVLDTSVR
jgi:hypothetical protein